MQITPLNLYSVLLLLHKSKLAYRRGVNSIHHYHHIMASADSKFEDFCLQCIQFE